MEGGNAAVPAAPAGPGIGERLTRARRDRGMSIEDVAQALRLSPRHIAALEDERFDDLHGPTYVRGYLRNYARLVGLPVDEVLAAYGQEPAGEATARPIGQPLKREVRSTDRPIKLITYLIVAVLGVLVVVWWQGQSGDLLRTPLAPPAGTPQPASDLPLDVAPAAGERATDAESKPVVGVPDPTADTEQAPDINATEAAAPSRAEDAGAPAPDSVGGAEPVPEEVGGAVPVDGASAAELPPATDAGGPAAPGVTRLTLRYDEACWTDIRDARGERLVYRTVPAGETVLVDGVAPLRVFFGNAHGVTLEVEGKPFDFSSSVRGVFARFSIEAGASAD